MANSDKNIVITPNRGLSGQPEISFTGVGNSSVKIKANDSTISSLDFESNSVNLLNISSQNQNSTSLLTIPNSNNLPIVETKSNKNLHINKTLDITSTNRLKLNTNNSSNIPGLLFYDKNDKQIKIGTNNSIENCNYDSIVTSGLVVYLDPNNPSSYNQNSGTLWRDLSGLGNDATLENGPYWVRTESESQYSPKYIYHAGGDDLITINDNTTLDIAYDKTVCCWVYLNADSGGCGIAGKMGSAVNGMGLAYGWNGNGFMNIAWNSSNSPVIAKDASRDIRKWVYVVGIQNNNYRYILAIDERGARGSSTTGAAISWNNGIPFRLGSAGDGGSVVPAGTRFGAVQVYNRALTQYEIEKNFNAQRSTYGI